jgi:hypothetical protein
VVYTVFWFQSEQSQDRAGAHLVRAIAQETKGADGSAHNGRLWPLGRMPVNEGHLPVAKRMWVVSARTGRTKLYDIWQIRVYTFCIITGPRIRHNFQSSFLKRYTIAWSDKFFRSLPLTAACEFNFMLMFNVGL